MTSKNIATKDTKISKKNSRRTSTHFDVTLKRFGDLKKECKSLVVEGYNTKLNEFTYATVTKLTAVKSPQLKNEVRNKVT
jgi:hypothetical protein